MAHVKQFGRGLWRSARLVCIVATLPLWIVPAMIYAAGSNEQSRDDYGW